MKKHTIHLHPLGKKIQVNDQTPLIDVLHELGIEFPCGGKGTCGKCRVRLLDGKIEISDIHQRRIDQLELTPEWRLACFSKCTGDLTLEIEQFNALILADESLFDFVPQKGFGIAATGLEILANHLSISLSDIGQVYIAGGFGNYINLENVSALGMIKLPTERICKMGNTALIGAKMFLFLDEQIPNGILLKTKHVNLEGDPNFQDIYVENMSL
ncbi:MAG: ASKHA domain-containing protein [Proteiniphilum sp.]|nr:ASKHA domain-containing protein [Proteiniphilum sp.]